MQLADLFRAQFRADFDFPSYDLAVFGAPLSVVLDFDFTVPACCGRVMAESVERIFTRVEPDAAQVRRVGFVLLSDLILESPACHILIESLVCLHFLPPFPFLSHRIPDKTAAALRRFRGIGFCPLRRKTHHPLE